jgi:hypothetical protein
VVSRAEVPNEPSLGAGSSTSSGMRLPQFVFWKTLSRRKIDRKGYRCLEREES